MTEDLKSVQSLWSNLLLNSLDVDSHRCQLRDSQLIIMGLHKHQADRLNSSALSEDDWLEPFQAVTRRESLRSLEVSSDLGMHDILVKKSAVPLKIDSTSWWITRGCPETCLNMRCHRIIKSKSIQDEARYRVCSLRAKQ